MKNRNRYTAAAIALLVAASGAMVVAQESAKPAVANTAGTFKVDPVHSFSMYRLTHLGVGMVYGTIKAPSGTLVQDADGLKSIEVTLDVDKIDSANEARDKHLKGPDFFNAKQFPQLTFKSTGVEKKDANAYEVKGDLTIKGNTKPLTVTLNKIGEGKGMQGELRAGYEGKFTINRLEYGIDWNPGAVGNDVELAIAVEGIQQ